MVPLLIAAAVFIILFLIIERRSRFPIIDLAMFRSRAFSSANFCNLLIGAALIIAMVDVPVFVTIKGGTPMESAMALMPLTLAMLAGALIGGALTDRIGRKPVAVAGTAMSALAFGLMHFWTAQLPPEQMARDLVICGVGLGLVIAPLGAAVIDSVKSTHYGIASALVIIMRLVGMTAGLSAVTGWALARANELLAQIPAVTQRAGETAAQFQERLTNYYWENSVRIMVMILNDVFLVAAVLMGVAFLAAFFIGRGRQANLEAPNPRPLPTGKRGQG